MRQCGRRPGRRLAAVLAVTAATGLTLVGCSGDPPAVPRPTTSPPGTAATAPGYSEVRVSHRASTAWGLLVDADGHILTSSDVIESVAGEPLQVGFRGGSTVGALAVGTDPRTRLGVIRVDSVPAGVVPAVFADGRAVAAGDEVRLRSGPESEPVPGRVTDVAMLSGNISMIAADIRTELGGPLYHADGGVAGIVTTFAASSDDGQAATSFAVPADLARRVTDQLIADGQAAHPYLGIAVEEAEGEAEEAEGEGVVVRDVVAGSPAATAGIRPGDVIIDVGGRAVIDPADLVAAVQGSAVGDDSTITYLRDGAERTAAATFVQAPEG